MEVLIAHLLQFICIKAISLKKKACTNIHEQKNALEGLVCLYKPFQSILATLVQTYKRSQNRGMLLVQTYRPSPKAAAPKVQTYKPSPNREATLYKGTSLPQAKNRTCTPKNVFFSSYLQEECTDRFH